MLRPGVIGGINPREKSSQPRLLTNVNGVLYFQANDGTNGLELWRIGASGITEIVERAGQSGGVNPGPSGSYPSGLTNVNGTLYFSAYSGNDGFELWRIGATGHAELVGCSGSDWRNQSWLGEFVSELFG